MIKSEQCPDGWLILDRGSAQDTFMEVSVAVTTKEERNLMANQGQLGLLQQGVPKTWNRWRLVHPDLLIDLDAADLSGWHLGDFNLSNAHLSGADLTNTDVNNANFHHAILIGANLSDANLARADLSTADL